MTYKSLEVGKLGEDIGCFYLINHGYKILFRNHREKFDEIDIISRYKNGLLVFIEVKSLLLKTDIVSKQLLPEDNFTKNKLFKIKRACSMFAIKHPELIKEQGWQIDLLAISILLNNNYQLKHFKNVIY